MRVGNFSQETNLYVVLAGLSRLEDSVEALKKKILDRAAIVNGNESTIVALKSQLREVGISSNGFPMPCHDLEESDSLERTARVQDCFINSMRGPLESVKLVFVDSRTETVKQSILDETERCNSNQDVIKNLRDKLREKGFLPDFPPIPGVVRVSKEEGELGRLENKLFTIQRRTMIQQLLIDSMKKQLEALS